MTEACFECGTEYVDSAAAHMQYKCPNPDCHILTYTPTSFSLDGEDDD